MGSENENLRRRIEEEKSKADDLKQENENKLTEKKKLTEVIQDLNNQFIIEKENWLKKEKELKENNQQLLTQINNLSAQIIDENSQINYLNDQIIVRDNQINNLNGQIIVRDNKINYLNDQIAVRDNKINYLNDQIAVRDKKINYLNDQIAVRDKQINELQLPINNMNNLNNQYQLMMQNQMSNNFIQNNQINNINNSQGFFINNNMNNNNNNQNNHSIKSLIFKFENGKICHICAFDRNRLKPLYYLAFSKINNDEYSDINYLQFFFGTIDITNHFLNNDFFESLNLPQYSIIYIIKLKNL